jgi:hypothetical protein
VAALDWLYCLKVGLVSGAGKVWSFSPVISSSGARFSVS